MKTALKTECQKAFCSKGFFLALLVGLLIVGAHLYSQLIEGTALVGEIVGSLNGAEGEYYAGSCFGRFILLGFPDIYGRLYVFLVPLLAALPHACSYYEEKGSGYQRQIVSRVGKRAYFLAKWAAIVLSGMVVVILPLIVDFLALMANWPFREATVLVGTVASYERIGVLFYRQHAFLYTCYYILLNGITGGVLASLGLLISFRRSSSFVVWMFPMAVALAIDFLCDFLGWSEMSPLSYLYAQAASYFLTPASLFLPLGIILVVGIVFVYWNEKQEIL